MRDRGALRAAAVRMFVCGAVIVTISITLVVAGQARVAHARVRAGGGRADALSPVTFPYAGTEQTYTVPAGVASLEVQAVGANGGAPSQAGNPDAVSGGTGGMVIGQLAVGPAPALTPGETLYVAVGGTPTGRPGGFNGGGSAQGANGSGGGGATDVRTCPPASASCSNGVPSPLTRLIVAAGGGGAGGCDDNFCDVPCEVRCGSGGDAGQPGFDAGLATGPHTGGGAGTLKAPGVAGTVGPPTPATSGGLDGTGGRGALEQDNSVGGGGGGAGYYGGGGGGLDIALAPNGKTFSVSAGGGGGGNFAAPRQVSNVSFGAGDGTPRLLITPRPASAIRITRIYYNSPGPDTATNKSLNAEWIRLTNTSRTIQPLRGWSITTTHEHVYRFGRLQLRPGASVTVHSGRGRDTASDRYWNRRRYSWDNRRDLARLHSKSGTLADQCATTPPRPAKSGAEPRRIRRPPRCQDSEVVWLS